jgi:glucose/arabinose dehydrogenase
LPSVAIAGSPAASASGGGAGASVAAAIDVEAGAASASAAAPGRTLAAAQSGIQAAALNLPAASDADGWLQPRGGFCVDQRLPQNERGITALAFAPDGRLFIAFDASLTDEPDPLILYDAHHPSRSIAIFDPATNMRPVEILSESTRITGMVYHNGALFLNRAGEVGWIPDGGKYQPLAGGFAVNSQLFHANNGIAIADGWLYVSAGGVIDGYSDGPIVGISEAGAQSIVSGGNRFAARLVRAPVDALISQRSIEVFQTAARGLRNPYGLTVDSSGRLWFTDNGATNVPDNVSAGDEVNVFDPRLTPSGTAEDATPYYGFPLAITGAPPDWYTAPVVALPNTAAPTGITWAYGTLFFGVYGRDPGLYRLGRAADGQVIAERVLLAWPLLATTTAPDGALWIGTGAGGLFRMTPGC